MERIETTILRNLIHSEDYSRKVIPFIEPTYFEQRTEKVIFEEIAKFIVKYGSAITTEALNIEKISEVKGIRAGCKVMKTRYAKPFEGVQVKIPYETGMNPYSGLVDLFEKKNLLQKDGNRLKHVNAKGEETKLYRKEWERNEEGCLDAIINSWGQVEKKAEQEPTEVVDEVPAQEEL